MQAIKRLRQRLWRQAIVANQSTQGRAPWCADAATECTFEVLLARFMAGELNQNQLT